jgi:ribonuclease HII
MIIGVDEVGRGCLFGPVVSSAVVLRGDHSHLGLTDSKKLSEKKREQIFEELFDGDHLIGIGQASPSEIDEINILQASLLSMKRAVQALDVSLDDQSHIFVDGTFKIPGIEPRIKQTTLIKGEMKEPSIAAASIVAKVFRDRLISAMEESYPGYGLKGHKGYPTKTHKEALSKLGPTDQHRKSFKGVFQSL